jgi:four helix bundle protein
LPGCNCSQRRRADSAGSADNAGNAGSADSAVSADSADNAGSAVSGNSQIIELLVYRTITTLYLNVVNIIRNRTKQFAVRVFQLIDEIPETAKGRVIQTQLAKAASSGAANYRAAQRSRSRAEFISKLSTTFEEVDESGFWLEFLVDTRLMTLEKVGRLLREADELCAMIAASRKTARANGKFRSRP